MTARSTKATIPGTRGLPPVSLPSGAIALPRGSLSLPRGAISFCSMRSALRQLEAALVPAGQEDDAEEQDRHEDHLTPSRPDRPERAALHLRLDLTEDQGPAQGQGEAVE